MADDNGPPMTITMVVCTVVSFIFMCLRFYCKQSMSTKVGLDDAILALSWVQYLFLFSFIPFQLGRCEAGTRTPMRVQVSGSLPAKLGLPGEVRS